MSGARDLLRDAAWTCAPCRADRRGDVADLRPDRAWVPATVPGTAAGALTDHGDDVALLRDYDRDEWWFRCRFAAPADAGEHVLHLGGLATLADVWLNGQHLLRSENMFVAHDVVVPDLEADNELLLRFSPLGDALAARRPRPRWRTVRVAEQDLRWVRTTLLGRTTGRPATTAPVGPWRPVSLLPRTRMGWRRRHLRADLTEDGRGVLDLDLVLEGVAPGTQVEVSVGAISRTVTVRQHDGASRLQAEVTVPDVEPWWPHTHGDQPLHDVHVVLGGTRHRVARVGFRRVEVDRTDGAFALRVNGVPVFARGTSWMPPDPDRLVLDPARLRRTLELLRDGNHNLVRVPGNTVYESPAFLDLLDELGLMLWQDAMVAFVDLPDDPDLLDSATTELGQVLAGLQGRPCVAVVCGGADTEEQGAYQGLPLEECSTAFSTVTLPRLVEELLPGVPYLRSTPGDSRLPTAADQGVCHYFGVGPYLHRTSDVRRAGVRFAAECLPFAVPAAPLRPGEAARWQRGLGPAPDPRHAVHRDSAQVLWDVEDTRDHYTAELFGVDVLRLRQEQPERAELLFAATAVELFEATLGEWRRPGSGCAGALTFYGHDLRPGPGTGLLDVAGRPKATWHAVRRTMAPVAVLLTDEGFSGLSAHVVNDTARAVSGEVRVELYARGETLVESAGRDVEVPARGGLGLAVADLLASFRDLTWVHRFGEPAADVVAVTLLDHRGRPMSQAVHLPGGPRRPVEPDLGLAGSLEQDGETWRMHVRTDRFAQRVSLHVPGWTPSDDWFHLLPGAGRTLTLRSASGGPVRPPHGRVLALNSARSPVLHRDPG
ncbi:hypothetical protein ASG49_14540 [Marmoricola sp. Leaf446]|uniref:glycosyl hydrolase 2 galactose-binding domain-containing protein n=1 Tax=Marmoricola sp. Leaf446 TaxID=1736379 RepID=UPI0006FE4B3C|nr:hypothetical protein [Marmoricola sp. Leaf446]KQT90926.1 hypothetical protein ASG49_14540 [Marmoricola sp. Leaf446]